jgi:hypothetical protein
MKIDKGHGEFGLVVVIMVGIIIIGKAHQGTHIELQLPCVSNGTIPA